MKFVRDCKKQYFFANEDIWLTVFRLNGLTKLGFRSIRAYISCITCYFTKSFADEMCSSYSVIVELSRPKEQIYHFYLYSISTVGIRVLRRKPERMSKSWKYWIGLFPSWRGQRAEKIHCPVINIIYLFYIT